jgi:hypothetical protein
MFAPREYGEVSREVICDVVVGAFDVDDVEVKGL